VEPTSSNPSTESLIQQALEKAKSVRAKLGGVLDLPTIEAAHLVTLNEILTELKVIAGERPSTTVAGAHPLATAITQLVQSKGLENHWAGSFPYSTSAPTQGNGLFDMMLPPGPQVPFCDLFIVIPSTSAYFETDQQIRIGAAPSTYPTPAIPANVPLTATAKARKFYFQGVSAPGTASVYLWWGNKSQALGET
jgi:hypothetical protein